MSVMDTPIVNVALTSLSRDFGVTESSVQWVVTGYMMSFAVSVPASDDRLSRVPPGEPRPRHPPVDPRGGGSDDRTHHRRKDRLFCWCSIANMLAMWAFFRSLIFTALFVQEARGGSAMVSGGTINSNASRPRSGLKRPTSALVGRARPSAARMATGCRAVRSGVVPGGPPHW